MHSAPWAKASISTPDLLDLGERDLAGQYDAVAELCVEFKGFKIRNRQLGGQVYLEPQLAGFEDAGHVRGDDRVDALLFCGFEQLEAEL